MLALLMAYKLKFIALIPMILGGLILLKGTTLLAGFFFALFAAVLGLKIHWQGNQTGSLEGTHQECTKKWDDIWLYFVIIYNQVKLVLIAVIFEKVLNACLHKVTLKAEFIIASHSQTYTSRIHLVECVASSSVYL